MRSRPARLLISTWCSPSRSHHFTHSQTVTGIPASGLCPPPIPNLIAASETRAGAGKRTMFRTPDVLVEPGDTHRGRVTARRCYGRRRRAAAGCPSRPERARAHGRTRCRPRREARPTCPAGQGSPGPQRWQDSVRCRRPPGWRRRQRPVGRPACALAAPAVAHVAGVCGGGAGLRRRVTVAATAPHVPGGDAAGPGSWPGVRPQQPVSVSVAFGLATLIGIFLALGGATP
jgi:hypothetical protein